MELQEIIRYGLTIGCFGFLVTIFIFMKQDKKLNLALFYSFLWTTLSLGVLNYICVHYNLWRFISEHPLYIAMPLDIYFMWIICWSTLPVYFFKGKYVLIIALLLLWLDIICMPYSEKIGILELGGNWLIGEFAMIVLVFAPSYLWAKFSFEDKQLAWRVRLQVISMGLILILVIPFLLLAYQSKTFILENNSIVNQIILIIALPSIIAVKDLYSLGKGSPFPLDPTKNLVQTGVYAYIKNPIQWSFTLLFIPLSILYKEPLLLIGVVSSVAYTIGISTNQENTDMTKRFGSLWTNYNQKVPKWRFLWKPAAIPQGTIYFKEDCNQCSELRAWFFRSKATNLILKHAHEHPKNIQQITYTDYLGNNHSSVIAFAHAMEHINLGWASLGWLMRLPVITYVLQAIVDAIGFGPFDTPENCELKKDK